MLHVGGIAIQVQTTAVETVAITAQAGKTVCRSLYVLQMHTQQLYYTREWQVHPIQPKSAYALPRHSGEPIPCSVRKLPPFTTSIKCASKAAEHV